MTAAENLNNPLTVRETVKIEMSDYQNQYGEQWLFHYFNNFTLKLPYDEQHPPFANARRIFPQSKWDTPVGEIFGDEEDSSPLLKSQTFRQFCENIDQAIIDSGVSIDEVKRLQGLVTQSQGEDRTKHRDELMTLLIPAYIGLRERGYSHYPDLTS